MRFTPGDLCEYDGTPLPVTRDGRGDACPACKVDLDRGDTVEPVDESEVQYDPKR